MHVREGASFDGTLSAEGELVYRMNDGRYAIVTADQREGNEGKYRVGFSATPEYDPDDILINPGSATVEEVRTALAGLNDGSLVVGERGLERAQTSKNAPASDGGVKIEQTPTEIANEAQRVENAGEASLRHDLPDGRADVDSASVTEEDVRTLLDRAKRKEYKDGSYIPVRANTPRVLIEAAADNGHTLRNVPFMMQVLKARQAMATPLEWAREGHFDSDAHDLTIDEIINIIYAMDSPKEIIYQSEDGRYVEVVEFEKQTGEKAVAVIEVGESKSPNYLNGYKGGIFQILVTAFGRNNEYIDSLSNKKGNKKVYPKKGKGASQSGSGNSVPSHLNDSPFANSIPQNGEKSTPSDEKVSENVSDNDSGRRALPKTREAKERKRKRAQEHQRQSREKRKAERMAEAMREEVVRNAEQNVEVNAEQGTEAAQETVEKAKIPARGYTDAEANDARALVKDFDLLPASTRRAIVELMRSGKASGASENFKRHSANLIAYWRKGLWIIADSKARDDGFYYVLDDGTRLITVNPKREAKAVSETLMHELAHDVWARADAKIRKTLYKLATAGVDQKEIEEIRERYRTELTNRGELTKRDADGNTVDMTEAEINALLDEEVATNLLGETIGTEEFLSRFDGEGKFAAAKRIWRTLYNMKKRFTGKDKYLYRKADDLFKTFTKVMAVEEVEGGSAEQGIRYSISPTLGTHLDQVLKGTFKADKNEVYLGETSNFMTETIGAQAFSLFMPASKAYSALVTKEEYDKNPHYAEQDNYHGIGKDDFIEILEKSETPIMAFAAAPDEDGNKRLNRIVLVTDKKVLDVQTGKYEYAVVIEEVDTTGWNEGKSVKANKTITVYPRSQLKQDIANAVIDNRLLYATKKGEHLFAGLQGSNPQGTIRKDVLEKNIAYFWANVKWKKEKNKTTSTKQPSTPSAFRIALEKAGAVDESGTMLTDPTPTTDSVEENSDLLHDSTKKVSGNVSDNDSGRRALSKKPKSQTTEKKARLTKEEKADEYKKVMDTIDENEGGYHTRLDYQKISEALDRRAKEKAKAQAKAKTQRPPEDEITRENFEKAVAAERERLEREAAARILAAEKNAKNTVKNAEKLSALETTQNERETAKRIRAAEKSAENARKNAEKQFEAEKNRIEKEASVLFNRTSREISKLDKNLRYLKHMASHQRATDGSIAAAVLLEDQTLKKFIRFLGKRGTALGVMHHSTREGVREFLSWYSEDNEVLGTTISVFAESLRFIQKCE